MRFWSKGLGERELVIDLIISAECRDAGGLRGARIKVLIDACHLRVGLGKVYSQPLKRVLEVERGILVVGIVG